VNYLRFYLVAEVTACILMAVQPTYASNVPVQDTSSSSPTTLSRLQTKQDDPIRSEYPNPHQPLAKALKIDENNQNLVNRTFGLIQGKIPVGNPVDNIDSQNLEQNQSIGLSNPSGIKKQPESLGNVREITQLPNSSLDTPVLPSAPSSPNGVMVPNPEIIIRSNGTANPDILNPTVPVAPVLPRAVAPPVGDMSISNITAGFDSVDLGPSGQAMIPRLVLRQAPAKEVLMVLARYAGVNIIFTDDDAEGPTEAATPGVPNIGGSKISLDLENQPVQQVFNSVLMLSRLKATKQGNTIFVGAKLPEAVRNVMMRTIRLNQVLAFDAATFLSSQGAQTYVYRESESATSEIDASGNKVTRTTKQQTPKIETIELDEKRRKATPLDGLTVSADVRLNSVTLVGDPRQINLATTLLTQLDARRRQVAVNVKIVDINLTNIQDYNSSFSFGYSDSYFVQDNGAAVMRFGQTAPLSATDLRSAAGKITNPPLVVNPLVDSAVFLNPLNAVSIPGITPGSTTSVFFPSVAAVSNNPIQTGLTNFGTARLVFDPTTGIPTYTDAVTTYGLPSYFQYPKRFQAQIFAQIQSGNAKILTDPTLVVQEGQKAEVKLVQSVVSSVNTQVDPLSGVRTTTPVLEDVGLTLAVIVNRIDDNGYISLEVIPLVASPGPQQQFDSGQGAVNTITLINKRVLTSGLLRLRDGQTLILSGIISEQNQSVSSKVPILGDLPIIGALFRSQSDQTDRSEVVVMLTPQIIHDNTESQFGYNYTPSKATADYLRQQGFPVQVQP
jgi:type IV pilus assembly protein PilQ